MVRVQQKNGSVQEYPNSSIRYTKASKTLTVTTADGKGTLIIDQAACSFIGQLFRCLLTSASLKQNGVTRPLDFETGTIYANTTDAKINLPMSTQGVPPHGLVMALKTKAGTYLSLTGTIDGGAK
jgi:hypothetical protein